MKDYQNFLDCLSKLISFRSVKAEAQAGKPFGDGVYGAYKYFLDLAKDMGFEVIDYDGYVGEVIFGEGEELGIIGHLDVVPEGNGWDTDPYTLTRIDDTFYARGIMDDKAPLLQCLFILKELKDSGVTPKRKFRLIVGCNEESGWEDVEYLRLKTTIPEYGFSPDGNFPVSYAEKGMAVIEFTTPALKNFYDLKGGTVINAVCGYATAKCKGQVDKEKLEKYGLKLQGDTIVSVGQSAHGSKPELGKNALKPLFEFFLSCGEEVGGVIDYLFNDKADISGIKNEQGAVTLSADIIEENNGKIYIKCDCRYPAPVAFKGVMERLDAFNIPYTYQIKHGAYMVDKDSELVSTLIGAYNSVTGENSNPQSQCGSTFARVFEKGVAFGPEFDGFNNRIHEPNERAREKDLLTAYEIYKKAIFTFAGVGEF